MWENPYPNNEFAEQDITLASADYDYYEMFYANNSITAESALSTKSIRGKGTVLIHSFAATSYIGARSRTVNYIDDTTLHVLGCISGAITSSGYSQSTINTSVIPLKVVGYKNASE